MTIEYLYSWNDAAGDAWVQKVEDGKVVQVNSVPIKEAKEKYYATRSKEMQAYDRGLEAAAAVEALAVADHPYPGFLDRVAGHVAASAEQSARQSQEQPFVALGQARKRCAISVYEVA